MIMVRWFILKLIFCSCLFCCLVAASCDPMMDGVPVTNIDVSADVPKGVDSVRVCLSYVDSKGDSSSLCGRKDLHVYVGEETPDWIDSSVNHSELLGVEEFYLQVQFYCSAGMTVSEPYNISAQKLLSDRYHFWNYEERYLGPSDAYVSYKLVEFVPPADTSCGKMVNYALMIWETRS